MDAKLWVPEYDTPELWHKEFWRSLQANVKTSRRCFFKSGITGFLGLVAMQHFDSNRFCAAGGCSPTCRALHRPVHEWRCESDRYFRSQTRHQKRWSPLQRFSTSVEGIEISEHLPHVAEQAHHLSIIRSMISREGNHERARYLLHTGYAPGGAVRHPTLGSIASYYLEDSQSDLPNCVNINAPTYAAGFSGCHARSIFSQRSNASRGRPFVSSADGHTSFSRTTQDAQNN